MGLFDKKYCSVCGEKIGLLGNRKLEDGNLCKDCAKKLSPWFEERRHSTVDQIKAQLQYREENKEAVRRFNITRSIGDFTKLLIDDDQRKFTVASGSDPLSSDPDILDFSQAAGIELNIDETRSEKKQMVDGKQVSYNPRKFEFSYSFRARILVSGNPYFDEMPFGISVGPVNTGERDMSAAAGSSGWTVTTNSFLRDRGVDQYYKYLEIGNQMKEAIDEMKSGPAVRTAAAPEEAAAPAPESASWVCAACGATNTGKFCEFCGTPRG